MVLRSLHDIADLPSILLAHSRLYEAFYASYDHPRIDKMIVQRQIDRRLLPLAIANIETSHRTYTDDTIQEVRDTYHLIFQDPASFVERFEKNKSIPTSDLIQMGRIHRFIGKLVHDYSSAAWQKIRGSTTAVVLSEAETLRFYRAFYHLELLFRLCKDNKMINMDSFPSSRAALVFAKFTPWELEQLSCVYRHLRERAIDAGKLLFPSRSHNEVIIS